MGSAPFKCEYLVIVSAVLVHSCGKMISQALGTHVIGCLFHRQGLLTEPGVQKYMNIFIEYISKCFFLSLLLNK